MFTDEGVFLEKDVVAFAAANLEDEFADVEQVVSAHSQLQGKNTPHFTSIFRAPAARGAPATAADAHTHPRLHRKLTARQSSATRRLSRAESSSRRRKSVRRIPDLPAQLRPSMSAAPKVAWRLSHKSHRRSAEASAEPDTPAERKGKTDFHISNLHKHTVGHSVPV